MYRLYYAPGAASLAAHWMLIDLGVPHELRKLDLGAGEHKDPEYMRLNPNGLVPTLVVDDAPVYECAAILMLLAERHPEARLEPARGTTGRMAYLQWMTHLTNTLQTAFRGWFYPHEAAGEAAAPRVKEFARSLIESAWNRVEAQLTASGGHIAGPQLTAADFLATMLMRWSRNMPRPATDWPTIRGYVDRHDEKGGVHVRHEGEAVVPHALREGGPDGVGVNDPAGGARSKAR